MQSANMVLQCFYQWGQLSRSKGSSTACRAEIPSIEIVVGAHPHYFLSNAASLAFSLILWSNRANEMAQWVKPPTAKPDNLSSILGLFRSLNRGKNVPWVWNRMTSNPYWQIAKYISMCYLGQPYISQLKAHAQSIMHIHEMANGVFINLLIYLVLSEEFYLRSLSSGRSMMH